MGHMAPARRLQLAALTAAGTGFIGSTDRNANPSNFASVFASAQPGERILLASGNYTGGISLYQRTDLIIEGPADRSARFVGQSGQNTIRVSGSFRCTLRSLTIDGLRLGGDGISAQSNFGSSGVITIENCRITGCDDSRSTGGLGAQSASVWDWIIRDNHFDGCGTGMYLGNSPGDAPFVRGIIERNLFTNILGYNIEIKGQAKWGSSIAGRPEGTTVTIIRNNTFHKSDPPSEFGGGARPCLLVGGHATSGIGVNNSYEIYGNLFIGNPTDEPLLQAAGKCSIHDNVMINTAAGGGSLGGIYMRDWVSDGAVPPQVTLPVKDVRIFNNTILLTNGPGIDISTAQTGFTRQIFGNAIFCPTPISVGATPGVTQGSNSTGTYASATTPLNNPAGTFGFNLDVHPKVGQLGGTSFLDPTWNVFTDYDRDFNGAVKNFTVRGAYATQGTNPGWLLQLARKGEAGPSLSAPTITSHPQPLSVTEPAGASFSVVATGTAPLSYQWRRNGVNISGATSTSYTLSATSVAADDGAIFTVVVTNALGSVTSNAASLNVDAPAQIGVNTTYADEGTLLPNPEGELFWQSGFATPEGTIVEWGAGNHNQDGDNSIRKFDPILPINSRQTYAVRDLAGNVRGNETYLVGGRFAGSKRDSMAYGYPTQHDNNWQFFSWKLNKWIASNRCVWDLATGLWTHATRSEADRQLNTAYSTGNSAFDGLPLGRMQGGAVFGTDADSIVRPINGLELANPDFFTPFIGDFNPHQAYSPQLDCWARIGGGSGGASTDGNIEPLYIIAPSANFGSFAQPYVAFRRGDFPTNVGGARPGKLEGRDGACFVGPYMYWMGGRSFSEGTTRHFFRMDMRPHILSFSSSFTSGQGVVERLPDAPAAGLFWLLEYDPYSNTLLAVGAAGVFLFDLATRVWSGNITPPGYLDNYNGPGDLPHGCLGGYIGFRGATSVKKFFWRAGLPQGGSTSVAATRTMHSIKVTRGQTVTALTVRTAEPTNEATFWANNASFLTSIKHQMLLDNMQAKVADGTYVPASDQANRKILAFSGDWDIGWPTGDNPPGFPPQNPGHSNPMSWGGLNDGRQEMWYADIPDASLAGGSPILTLKLAQNYYHNYPWSGSSSYVPGEQSGYFGAGRPGGGTVPERGPYMPDALPFIVDKRGDFWMGPCSVGYNQGSGDAAGEYDGNSTSSPVVTPFWCPMYRWRMPPRHPTTQVRLGGDGLSDPAVKTGWHKPNQDRIKMPTHGGVKGTHFEAGRTTDSESLAVGRPNTAAYDPVTDKIYTVGIQSGTNNVTITLYGFSCVPSAGKHLWSETTLAPITYATLGYPQGTTNSQWQSVGEKKNGNAASLVYCNDAIYFALLTTLDVPAGQGNSTLPLSSSTVRHVSWLMKINIRATPTPTVEWIPYPVTLPWWERSWDGPNAPDGYRALTPGQNRTMRMASATKIAIGPGTYHHVTLDPWIVVYDTVEKLWTSFDPPASYPVTNGGHDWPNSLFSFTGMPSLGEVWLAGKGTQGDDPNLNSPDDLYLQANGMWRGGVLQKAGQLPSLARRIIRFKVT